MKLAIVSLLVAVTAVTVYAIPKIIGPSMSNPHEDWIRPGESIESNLPEIAERQGLDPNLFRCDTTNAAMLQANGLPYAIVVQTLKVRCIPGDFTQQLVLVNPRGEILDRLRCEINGRNDHRLECSITEQPEEDGVYCVVRFPGAKTFTGKTILNHGWHRIIYHRKAYRFIVPPSHGTADAPTIWTEKGLCRLGIADNQFVVIFPRLENPEPKEPLECPIVFTADELKRNEKLRRLIEGSEPLD